MLKYSSMSGNITPSSRDCKKATLPCCKNHHMHVGILSSMNMLSGNVMTAIIVNTACVVLCSYQLTQCCKGVQDQQSHVFELLLVTKEVVGLVAKMYVCIYVCTGILQNQHCQ